MQIIDIHNHIYPEKIARKATDSVRDFYQLDGSDMDGTVEMLRRRGAEAGISRYVVLPVSNTPDRVQSINDFLHSQTQIHDDFIGFGTLHAAMDSPVDELERILSLELRGIKMHPDSQRFHIDDEGLFPVYEAMGDRLPVMFHTAWELLRDTDCIFDTSSALMFMERGEAEHYINAYGAERMAYGTDSPLWDPVTEMKRFMQLDLTDEQFEQILHKTAERILNL